MTHQFSSDVETRTQASGFSVQFAFLYHGVSWITPNTSSKLHNYILQNSFCRLKSFLAACLENECTLDVMQGVSTNTPTNFSAVSQGESIILSSYTFYP